MDLGIKENDKQSKLLREYLVTMLQLSAMIQRTLNLTFHPWHSNH